MQAQKNKSNNMDIKTAAVQLMALKTRAEMADRMGNTQQKREVLEQMRTLVKQVMDSDDPGRFVLMATVYGMLQQATIDTDINQATEYAYECLEYSLPLAEDEDSERSLTMLMASIMSVIMCLLAHFDRTQSTKYLTALFPLADMYERIIDDLIDINPSGMAALRGQKTVENLRAKGLLGNTDADYSDLDEDEFAFLKELYDKAQMN